MTDGGTAAAAGGGAAAGAGAAAGPRGVFCLEASRDFESSDFCGGGGGGVTCHDRSAEGAAAGSGWTLSLRVISPITVRFTESN